MVIYCILFIYFFVFSGLFLQHMEIPRLGVKSELQLPAYTTVTATQDLSGVCDLYHSSQQHQILNPLSASGDRTHNLMVPSRIRFCCATTGTPNCCFLIYGQASRNGAQQILNTEPAAVKSESLLRRLYKFRALTAF